MFIKLIIIKLIIMYLEDSVFKLKKNILILKNVGLDGINMFRRLFV